MTSKSLVELGMLRWRLVITIVGALLVYGVASFLSMPRQEFPEFTIRQGLVIGVMPGASTAQVEERLTPAVENYLFSFNEVNKKKTYSVSQEGRVIVFVELGDEVSAVQAPAFWAKLRHGLNELKMQLPSTVVALIGNNDFGDTSALLFTVEAPGRSPRDLQKYLEVLESHLRRLDATAKLRRYGLQHEVIRVSISRERLARYAVRPALVFSSLQGLGATPVTNRLDGNELEMPVHIASTLSSESELGNTILFSEPTGNHIRLKDVATIKREYGHDDSFVRANGNAAVVLSVEMRSGHDITRYGEEVDSAIAAATRELPGGVKITRIADQPKVVKSSIGHFMRDFGFAIVAVILVTMLLLPIRVAAVAAISIPVCIGMTVGVLNVAGVQLQTVSLAALVVVLGMVVDNAIVIIDDYVEKLDTGMARWEAAWRSAHELALPVATATLAIVLAYVPMAFLMKGMAGDFIGSLPITVTVALVTSLLTACFLVPIMNFAFIRKGIRHHTDDAHSSRDSFLERLQRYYDALIEIAFRHPWITLGAGVMSFVVALLGTAIAPQQPFPKVERSQFAIEVSLPPGRSLQQTDQVVQKLEAQLLADKRVTGVTSFVGDSSPRFHTLYAPNMPARNYAQLIVNTVADDDVVELVRENETRGRELFPEAWVRWKQLDFSIGSPIEVRLSGVDLTDLKQSAAKIEALARTLPGTTRVFNDFQEPTPSIDVLPDADAAARLGVPPSLLQLSLVMGLQGFPVATLWEQDYPVSVLLKDDAPEAHTIEGLRQQYVSSPLLGATVPLEQLAVIRPAWNEGAIVRRNGIRTLTVKVDVLNATLTSGVQQQLVQGIKRLALSPGLHIDYGGEVELAQEVYPPLTRAMVVTVALIYLVLLWQFERHRKAFLVMVSMPLVLFGAVFGLRVGGYPFGITAFLGVIGLLGIVVRNGIILVGYAETLRRTQGMSVRAAALAAGKRRMRPIYLTSMAAAVGVVPMILSRSTLWGPLGSVTCFGLLFAMVLTLFVLPVAYALVAKVDEVEPGQTRPTLGRAGGVAGLLAVMLLPALGHAQAEPHTLAECRTLARERNAAVLQAALEVDAAEATRDAAFTHYFPQVSATVAALAVWDPLVSIQTQGGNLPVYDGDPANLMTATQFAYMPSGVMQAGDKATLLSLTALQPLFAGGRILNGNRLASLAVDVAKDKLLMTEREAVAQTEEKYWRIVTLTEKLQTIASAQTLLARLEQEVTDAAVAGLITQNDLLKVALQRRQLQVDQERLSHGIALATQDLQHHLGLPTVPQLTLTDRLLPPADPGALVSAQAGAVERRLETRLYAKAVDAERLQTSIKQGEMLPSVMMGATVMRYDISGLGGAINNAMVFGVASVPFTAIWEGYHVTASQRDREEVASHRLADLRAQLGLQVTKSWDDLVSAWHEAQVADAAVAQAAVNIQESTDRHASGLVTLADLLEAQVLERQALDRRTDAYSDYWLKDAAYRRVTGND